MTKSNLLLASPGLLDSSTAFVGFTAATSSALNNHDLLNWGYSEIFLPQGFAAVPEPSTFCLTGLGLLLFALARLRPRIS